jgi:hypothetical protein
VVERFLSELLKRGAHFCIPFFASHAQICTEPGTAVFRSLLIHHLKVSLAGKVPVVNFDSPASEEWHSFLSSFQPALVAVSDSIPADAPSPFPLRSFAIACLSAGIHDLVQQHRVQASGLNVELVERGDRERSLWIGVSVSV